MNRNGRFGNLEIAASIKNLLKYLPGSYLQKFYRLPQKGNQHAKRFMLRFSCRPFRHLLIDVGIRAHLIPDSAYEDNYMEHLPRDGLCSKLKKHLNNARVTGINYYPGSKYFEIEFTHFYLAFDFYGVGNLILFQKPDNNLNSSDSIILETIEDVIRKVICISKNTKYTDYDSEERKKSKVLISWYPGIKAGSYYVKDYNNIKDLDIIPDGKGYILKDKLYSYNIPESKCYSNFGEAVFELMDKNTKSKLLPKKQKKKKSKPDYKKQQLKKWQSKVDKLQFAVDWLSERCYLSLEQCIKEKPTDIKLKFEKTVYGTLGIWNQELKKAKRKLESANKVSIKENKIKIKPILKLKLPKKAWYQSYRWFFTYPQNLLVVAGTSAKKNEELVKKHFDNNDLYFHGDFHGASSVILKTEGKTPNPSSLEQAGAFAVCCSSSWKSNITGRPYFVNKKQVSKTAESGEYLSQGSFMVRGKRNYLRDQLLILGVAITESNRLTVGPISAVRHLSSCIKFKPGKTKKSKGIEILKNEMVKKLKKIDEQKTLLAKSFIQEEWQQLIPIGIKVSKTINKN